MTSNQRKALEGLAAHYEHGAALWSRGVRSQQADEMKFNAAAIRAALAEIDALHEALGAERSRVTNLCRLITGRAADNELSNERLGEACREVNRLHKQVRDLEARAIPKAWVESLDSRTLWVSLESPGDGTRDVCVRFHDGLATIERVVGTDRMFIEAQMPLSAALAAAAKESP